MEREAEDDQLDAGWERGRFGSAVISFETMNGNVSPSREKANYSNSLTTGNVNKEFNPSMCGRN